ncbi:Uncharacterised protein [Anaerostipes hadrus]|uniref:DUF3800 domain-containing protein n=1 Tax=Anaerostipes hadrus TaxID=649756 RepID=A0A174TBY7_ANAHA|nr:DUF3800 domain-containing protein [Anaerostipes hadrus]CUQ07483.1 Uncharacterised protein [Anaerostipes hadrus]
MNTSTIYKFYYDETEHSRKINHKTVIGSEYYDNFMTAIVGWPADKEKDIFVKYAEFEEKYSDRKSKGELKSTTLKQQRFKSGIASLKENNLQFIYDFLSIFDEDFKLYFSVVSKIEYIILQIFNDYKNNDKNEIIYTIVKSIMKYQPKNVLNCIYEGPSKFILELKNFYVSRIQYNHTNLELKSIENSAFKKVLISLNELSEISTIQWDYKISFDGFSKFLQENNIKSNYSLTLDKEGPLEKESNTLQAAKIIGLNATECDSTKSCGLRIADMIAGIVAKLMKALNNAMKYNGKTEHTKKKILDEAWFQLNDMQINIYKKLYSLILEWNPAWYKIYAGIYSDDLILFISLLEYVNSKNFNIKGFSFSDDFNSYVCNRLINYYESRHTNDDLCHHNVDYIINSRGAKVYYDINKQPFFQLNKPVQIFKVLSVGVINAEICLITISENGNAACYRLPGNLNNWVYSIMNMQKYGINILPANIKFYKEHNKYYVEII